MASSSRKTFPLDEDIFAPFRSPMPNTTIPLGRRERGKIATWWKSWNVRWFEMRSFAENRKSYGYQNKNSRRIRSSVSRSGSDGDSFPRKI